MYFALYHQDGQYNLTNKAIFSYSIPQKIHYTLLLGSTGTIGYNYFYKRHQHAL